MEEIKHIRKDIEVLACPDPGCDTTDIHHNKREKVWKCYVCKKSFLNPNKKQFCEYMYKHLINSITHDLILTKRTRSDTARYIAEY